jgi:histone acetyltransferase (RNA polymerase elongator complex component)
MEQTDNIENIEDIIKPFWFKGLSPELTAKCYEFLDEYYYNRIPMTNIVKKFEQYQRQHKFSSIIKFGYLIYFYKLYRQNGLYPQPNKALEKVLKVKNVRENSGVMVYSIFTSGYPSYTRVNPDGTSEIVNEFGEDHVGNPGKYSCKYNCFYCPDYPDMPRSYLPGEPSVDRAIQCNFEVFKMIIARATQYLQQGHSIDKAEVIVQGGTWDTYSYEYRTEFIRNIYYTFNVVMDYLLGNKIREPLTLKEEINLNETSSCRVIGLTVETRPDQINYKSIQFLRDCGITRVQLGVQHLDDKILRYVNRRCYTKDTIRAIQMLKDAGKKVDIHLMLDLPSPSSEYEGRMPEIDSEMLHEFNTNPVFKADQIKLYPCVVTPYTKIKEWYEAGTYKPYGELKKMTHDEKIAYRRLSKEEKLANRLANPLYKNIFDFYQAIHPSIRINRVFRDIPTNVICGGTTQTSMRQELDMDFEALGLLSTCIRYREAGNTRNKNRTDIEGLVLKELKFEASGGTEYFLTWESVGDDPVLYSFLRLRFSANSGRTDTGKIIFPELIDCAMIRELHTYGKATPCKENQKHYANNNIMFAHDEEDIPQHKGLGKKLMARAEEIAKENGYKKIFVIAGVGVREYYRKLGYNHDSEIGSYQIKFFDNEQNILIPDKITHTPIADIEMGYFNKLEIGVCLVLGYFIIIGLVSWLTKYFM